VYCVQNTIRQLAGIPRRWCVFFSEFQVLAARRISRWGVQLEDAESTRAQRFIHEEEGIDAENDASLSAAVDWRKFDSKGSRLFGRGALR
jgi:hypothetical protein